MNYEVKFSYNDGRSYRLTTNAIVANTTRGNIKRTVENYLASLTKNTAKSIKILSAKEAKND